MREVDEAVRQDRWTAIWKHYGAYIVGAALAVVIGTAAGVGWRSYQEGRIADEARRLAAAEALTRDDQAAGAVAFGSLAEDVGGGVGLVARLRAADALGQAGDSDAKTALLEEVAANADADPLYQRLASLLAVQERFSESDATALAAELDAAAAGDNPWRPSLLELKALAEIKAGDTERAKTTLAQLIDSSATPPGMAQRASELLEALGGRAKNDEQAVSENDETAAEATH
jgi:hypothetical protein